MILQQLTRYYETMLERGEISSPGWDDNVKVTFGLELAEDGQLLQLLPLKMQQQRGKKLVEVPRGMRVPARAKKTSGVAANFLCDTAVYMLGIDTKGKPERTRSCFEANRALHREILAEVDSPAARAILAFFETWEQESAAEHPCLTDALKELMGGVNLIFCHEMQPVTEDPAIRSAWQRHYSAADEDAKMAQCLVTGQMAPVARLHPNIKGVRGAQATGASLVSFNAPAFESYGQTQGDNAPVGRYAAFAYTTALNALLASNTCRVIGDTTVVCWAECGEPAYQQFGMSALFDQPEQFEEQDLYDVLDKLAKGAPCDWDGFELDPEEHFYILGLAPNAGRLSVRFFLRDSFGRFMQNLKQHYRDIAVVHNPDDHFAELPIWKLLGETVNQNSRSKDPQPQLAGDMLRAVLMGSPYPATLLNGAQLRIRAEHEVTRGRAAIIKGYYTRLLRAGRSADTYPKEDVLQMELNEHSMNLPYTLGRLFSLYEQIQEAANPGINATIKDKYFNSASCTPATIFPLLGNLAEKHLRVIRRSKPGLAVTLEKRLGEMAVRIGEGYPVRLSLPEQGSFQLGYYFEKQARYQKKEQ